MEPQLPTPNFGPEAAQQPAQQSRESIRVPHVDTLESQATPLEQGAESREGLVGGPGVDPVVVTSPPPIPTVGTTDVSVSTIPVDDTPIIAADEDLIEKEWVEKAKKVVAENRNDPYAQDQAVGRLQADYLQKRYGKSINIPSGG